MSKEEYKRTFQMIIQAYEAGIISEQEAREIIKMLNRAFKRED
jgi:hypothetical protein